MISSELKCSFHWQGSALCRRFLAAHFGSFSSRGPVEGSRSLLPFAVVWGVGELADGQRELLGVWPRWPDDRATWASVLADLWMRGVEQIEQAVTLGLVAPDPDHPASRPRVGRWCEAATPRSRCPIGSGRRALQLADATGLAEQAQAFLLRSSPRRGLFETEEAGIAFVAGQLERIVRRRGERSLS